ncbi:hypothetical protein AB4K20DRAFT_1866532 [Rhizopus microsporus]
MKISFIRNFRIDLVVHGYQIRPKGYNSSSDHGDTFFLAFVVTDWWYGLYSKRLKKYVVKKSKKYRNSNPDFYVTGKLVLFNSRLIQGQLGWRVQAIDNTSVLKSVFFCVLIGGFLQSYVLISSCTETIFLLREPVSLSSALLNTKSHKKDYKSVRLKHIK